MTTVYKVTLSIKEFDVKEVGCLPPLASLYSLGFEFRDSPKGHTYAVLYTDVHPMEWGSYDVKRLLNSNWGERLQCWEFETDDDHSGRTFDLRQMASVDC